MSMNIWKAITARFLADSRMAEDVEAHRVLSEIVRRFETGEGGVLTVPVISCGVVGHAPDCECATL